MTAAFKQRRTARNPHAYIIGTAEFDGLRLMVKVADMGRYNQMWLSLGKRRMVQIDTDKGSESAALESMLAAIGARLTAVDSRALGQDSLSARNMRTF